MHINANGGSIETFENTEITVESESSCKERKLKNLIGFWILGLCNNYAYVIMLSAAFDLLKEKQEPKTHFCNPFSTGAVLLADILPALGIKLVSPFVNVNINIRVFLVIVLSAASFILTSLSEGIHWIIFTGVICAALSSGLGEVTFLALSSYFHKDVVSSWSSGTGGAGVVGAFSYAFFAQQLGPITTLQVMLIFPVLMVVTFWFIIDRPPVAHFKCKMFGCSSELEPMIALSVEQSKRLPVYSFKQKLILVQPLLKYMVPLGLVYFAEYFINQGLMELLYFGSNSLKLKHEEQYRWYQAVYQIGVFISRSSVNLFQINKLWILPILQVINMVFLLCEAYYYFLPSIWIVFVIIFYEGLLGGLAYVNTFYKISEEIPKEHRDFSMGVASLGDSMGIALAGAISLPVHKALCNMHP